jgi:hypothetical protein
MKSMMPQASVELSPDDIANTALVNVQFAIASLTIAWHHVLRVEAHDEVAHRIERALESAIHLRDAIKQDAF